MRDLTAGQQILLLVGAAVMAWRIGATALRWTGGLLAAAGAVTLAQGADLSAGVGVLVTGVVIWATGHAIWRWQHGAWWGSDPPLVDEDDGSGGGAHDLHP